MKTRQNINSILVYMLFVAFVPEINAQTSPCPSVFQYIYDGLSLYGEINIPSAGPGRTTLKIRLGVDGVLDKQNTGQVDLLTDKSDVVEIVKNGGTLKYKIIFPVTTSIPAVLSIKLNNREYCANTQGEDSSTQSIITSQHLFTLSFPEGSYVPPVTQIYPIPTHAPVRASPKPPPLPPQNQPQLPSSDLLLREPTNSNWLSNFKFNNMCGSKVEEKVEAVHTIINGFPVQKGEYPWLVALFLQKTYICSASLVTNLHVITAAHCTTSQTFLIAQLGKHNLYDTSESGVFYRFSQEIYNHPNYQVLTGRGDISVIRFNEPVIFSDKVRPICLWPFTTNNIGETGTIAGWGNDISGTNTEVPMQVQVDIVDDDVCKKSHEILSNITGPDTYCAGGKKAGPCFGDSGSGMIIQRDRWYLRGVISISIRKRFSCDVDNYAVYCDVGKNLEWLKSILL